MKITIATIEKFRKSADFLKKHEAVLGDSLHNPANVRELRYAITSVGVLARKLGEAELTVRG